MAEIASTAPMVNAVILFIASVRFIVFFQPAPPRSHRWWRRRPNAGF
jgi:hypothetical protein